MRLLTWLPLLTVGPAAAAHIGGQCSFHVRVEQKCTRAHLLTGPETFVSFPFIFDGAHNRFYLPSHDGGPTNARKGNELGGTKDFGGNFRWLPWADQQEDMRFEYNGRQWSENSPKNEGFYCDVGGWLGQGKLTCGKDKNSWPRPRVSCHITGTERVADIELVQRDGLLLPLLGTFQLGSRLCSVFEAIDIGY
jgi:hypothetical protein